MKIAKDRRPDLKKTSPKENLNLSSVACDPCSNEALKIERQIKSRPVSEIKINEIKLIVNSIFKSGDNDKQ